MLGDRCSICDWNAMGMCANFEIDKYISKGQKNIVLYDIERKINICLKCHNAIEGVKYEHLVKDEKEALLLLEDFSDKEIEELSKTIEDD